MFKLAKYVSSNPYLSGGVFGAGSKQILFKNKEDWKIITKIAMMWKRANSLHGVKKIALKEIGNDKAILIDRALNTLLNNRFLMKHNLFNPSERYSRHKLYFNLLDNNPEKVQKNIENSSVTILGCGGIGSHIAHMLATSGLKKITLIDNDTIELSNLSRQFLFTEQDIGKKKIDILHREIKKRNRNIEIEMIDACITSYQDLVKVINSDDLIILSADSPFGIVSWVNKFCVDYQTPYISIGYINDISVVGPLYIPNKSGCYHCSEISPSTSQDREMHEILEELNEGFKPASFPSVNGVAAYYAFGDIIKFLGKTESKPLSINKRIGIHSLECRIETQVITKNEGCLACGTKPIS